MNGIKIFMSHNFSSTVRTRASTLHIAPLPESGKISDFGNPSFVLINWDCLKDGLLKIWSNLMSEQVGQLYKNSFEQSNSGKNIWFLRYFLLIVFAPSPAPLLKRPSKDAALVSKATVIAFTKLGWLLIPRNFLFLLK